MPCMSFRVGGKLCFWMCFSIFFKRRIHRKRYQHQFVDELVDKLNIIQVQKSLIWIITLSIIHVYLLISFFSHLHLRRVNRFTGDSYTMVTFSKHISSWEVNHFLNYKFYLLLSFFVCFLYVYSVTTLLRFSFFLLSTFSELLKGAVRSNLRVFTELVYSIDRIVPILYSWLTKHFNSTCSFCSLIKQ